MDAIDGFKNLLTESTAQIKEEYIQLPVAGQEDNAYRERVYCYELYHQLRSHWPQSLDVFSLSGEVDKSGHGRIRGNNLDRRKPDLLVHVPGGMDNNLVIIEVKPANGDYHGLEKDLETLTAFRKSAKYQHAIHLTYNENNPGGKDIIMKARDIQKRNLENVDLQVIEFWYHGGPGRGAYCIEDVYE